MDWIEWLKRGVEEAHWGDYSSIVGLFVALVGFAVTLRNVAKSRKAAEQAESAVASLRQKQQLFDATRDLSSALAIMDEIKRLHRAQTWIVLTDRYGALKNALISIKASHLGLTADQRSRVQSAITHFTQMERQIEEVVAGSKEPPDVPQLNKVVSTQIERLTLTIAEIRNNLAE